MVIDDEKKILQYHNENTYFSMYLWDAIQSNRSVFAAHFIFDYQMPLANSSWGGDLCAPHKDSLVLSDSTGF